MTNHTNKSQQNPSQPVGSKDDRIKVIMHYTKHPNLNENENKIKVTCIEAGGNSMTKYLPSYKDGDPKEKLLMAFYKLEWVQGQKGQENAAGWDRMLSKQSQQLWQDKSHDINGEYI